MYLALAMPSGFPSKNAILTDKLLENKKKIL